MAALPDQQQGKWQFGIFATMVTVATTGLVAATIAHGQLLAKLTAQVEAMQVRQTAYEGRSWSDFRDMNERLRFVERRVGGAGP